VERIRSEADKPWHACMTTIEFESLRVAGEGKLAARSRLAVDGDDGDEEDAGGASKKKRRKKATQGGATQTARWEMHEIEPA